MLLPVSDLVRLFREQCIDVPDSPVLYYAPDNGFPVRSRHFRPVTEELFQDTLIPGERVPFIRRRHCLDGGLGGFDDDRDCRDTLSHVLCIFCLPYDVSIRCFVIARLQGDAPHGMRLRVKDRQDANGHILVSRHCFGGPDHEGMRLDFLRPAEDGIPERYLFVLFDLLKEGFTAFRHLLEERKAGRQHCGHPPFLSKVVRPFQFPPVSLQVIREVLRPLHGGLSFEQVRVKDVHGAFLEVHDRIRDRLVRFRLQGELPADAFGNLFFGCLRPRRCVRHFEEEIARCDVLAPHCVQNLPDIVPHPVHNLFLIAAVQHDDLVIEFLQLEDRAEVGVFFLPAPCPAFFYRRRAS